MENQNQFLFEENQELLLSTIQVPKNLQALSERLPGQTYDKSSLEQLKNFLSPRIPGQDIKVTTNYLQKVDRSKIYDYNLAPHHLMDMFQEIIHLNPNDETLRLKEKEYEENFKKSEKQERREKRKLKELQDKKELEELLKQEQQRLIRELELQENINAETLKNNLKAKIDDVGHELNKMRKDPDLRKFMKDNLIKDKNIHLNKFKSNNNIREIAALKMMYLSKSKKKEKKIKVKEIKVKEIKVKEIKAKEIKVKEIKVKEKIENKNYLPDINRHGSVELKNDSYYKMIRHNLEQGKIELGKDYCNTPLMVESFKFNEIKNELLKGSNNDNNHNSNSPKLISKLFHHKANPGYAPLKNLNYYELENIYKPKKIEREGGKIVINRKLSPIKRKLC